MNYTASDNSRFHTLLSFSLSCSYQNNHPSKMQVFILWPLTKRTFLVVMALSALFASVISHHDFDSPTPTEQFLSAVSIANGTKHICNGVILNKRWIITSAYCLENYIVPTDLEVNFGTRIGRQSKFSVVEKIVVHPDYHQRYFLNNVALIKVQADMEFNAGVQASGLPIADAEEDDVVYAVAWAKADQNSTSTGGEGMRFHQTRVMALDLCWERLEDLDAIKVNDNIICTYPLEDISAFESGSALISAKHELLGIASFPNVYVKIQSHRDWIESVISS